MTITRIQPTSTSESSVRPERPVSRLHVIRRAVPAVSLTVLLAFAAGACGGSADADTQTRESLSESESDIAEATDADADADDDDQAAEPDACSLLTVEDLKAATGRTFAPGEGTDYDNSCTFDTDSDRVTVSVSDTDGLELAEPIGVDVAPVDGLPGATRVDAVVYVERDGVHLSVGTGLPGFAASELDVSAAEALAKIAADRL